MRRPTISAPCAETCFRSDASSFCMAAWSHSCSCSCSSSSMIGPAAEGGGGGFVLLLLSVVPPVALLGLWAGEGAGAAAAVVDIFACLVDRWMEAIEYGVLDWCWLD